MLNIFKPIGLTPLQVVGRVREKYPEYKGLKLGFAGRLDPLAEGVMLLLVGDENKNKIKYETLPKEYEFEILLGFSTDTFDTMGKLMGEPGQSVQMPSFTDFTVINCVISFKGPQTQKYPIYSSKRVNGKALVLHAMLGTTEGLQIPKKEVEVYEMGFVGKRTLVGLELLAEITQRILRVEGNFRQKEIIAEWGAILSSTVPPSFDLFRFRAAVSSGTYIRVIAHEVGKKLGCGAVAYSIKRLSVGPYSLKDSLSL